MTASRENRPEWVDVLIASDDRSEVLTGSRGGDSSRGLSRGGQALGLSAHLGRSAGEISCWAAAGGLLLGGGGLLGFLCAGMKTRVFRTPFRRCRLAVLLQLGKFQRLLKPPLFVVG